MIYLPSSSWPFQSPRKRRACRSPGIAPGPGGQTARSSWPPARSSLSGGWRQGPRHCRRGSIRRTKCNPASAGPTGIFPCRRRRAACLCVPQEDAGETAGDLLAHLEQVHHLSRAGGTFDPERVAIVEVVAQQRPDDERVHRHPDGAAPVGVAAEHARIRLRWQILHPVGLAVHLKDIGVFQVVPRQRPDAVGTQEFVFVQHPGENPAQPLLVHQSENATVSTP